jgi:hypothetical protein
LAAVAVKHRNPPLRGVPVGRGERQLLEWCGRASGKMLGPWIGRALASRIAEAADEGELDDIYETERQLSYVACTQARDRLLVTGVSPGSEFLKDL